MNGNRNKLIWGVYLLLIRLWLGHSMINGGQSILHFADNKEFFQHWFGDELGFPAPVFMAFLAKGTEFAGGILVCFGLFTRVSSSLIAFVMLIATLVANIDYQMKEHLLRQDASITISSFLFASILAISGGGIFSLDHVIFRKKIQAYLAGCIQVTRRMFKL